MKLDGTADHKRVVFVSSAAERRSAAAFVDLRDEATKISDVATGATPLEPILQRRSAEWKSLFSGWLGELNNRNASLRWWTYATTAKNLLSVPLGMRLLSCLAVAEVLDAQPGRELFIVGATLGQRRTLSGLLRSRGFGVDDRTPLAEKIWLAIAATTVPLRILFQILRAAAVFARVSPAAAGQVDVCLFTYADPPFRRDSDLYFGSLHLLLTRIRRDLRVGYISFVEAPYRGTLRTMRELGIESVVPLFAFLRPSDFLWALAKAFRECMHPAHSLDSQAEQARELRPLLEEALSFDLSSGSYALNLLAFRAARRLGSRLQPDVVIYPFENKALEKALLMGLRAKPGTYLVGYQHTSVTPRHVTLLLEPGEAGVTPLPDRIVTVGEVTRSYLERHGNYPPGMLEAGCALRQQLRPSLPHRGVDAACPRILLALSSSRNELVQSIAFFQRVSQLVPGMTLGVRAHPNFPTSMLPGPLRDWLREYCRDLSGSPLDDNLEWCDCVAYVSSTVALEALMAGRPILKLGIDPLDPDPVLDEIAMRWTVDQPEEMVQALTVLAEMTGSDIERRRQLASEYVRSYLAPVTDEALGRFLR